MLPLTDLVRPARFPWVTLALVAGNLLVWTAYELPAGVDHAADTLGFRPCEVSGVCGQTGQPWPVDSFTSMFTHGGWSHVVGNLVFLLAVGPRIEDMLGHARYLLLYLAAGFAADALQGSLTLAFASHADAAVPNIGASGAVSGILGAYALAYPFERILTWLMPAFFLRIPALALFGIWFLLQALDGAYALDNPDVVVGVAFFAHVGGFLAGAAGVLLIRRRRPPRPARAAPGVPLTPAPR